MATTDPITGFVTHDTLDVVAPIHTYVNDVVTPINTWAKARVGVQQFRWADAAARGAQAGMVAGDRGYQIDTAVTYRYDGSAWVAWESDWITWATAPTNLTVGTGGSASTLQRYKWVAGCLSFEVKYVLGSSGSSVGTAPSINLPLSISLTMPSLPALTGEASLYDLSTTGSFYGKFRAETATAVRINSYTGTFANITATAPFTWAAGDILGGTFWANPA